MINIFMPHFKVSGHKAEMREVTLLCVFHPDPCPLSPFSLWATFDDLLLAFFSFHSWCLVSPCLFWWEQQVLWINDTVTGPIWGFYNSAKTKDSKITKTSTEAGFHITIPPVQAAISQGQQLKGATFFYCYCLRFTRYKVRWAGQ